MANLTGTIGADTAPAGALTDRTAATAGAPERREVPLSAELRRELEAGIQTGAMIKTAWRMAGMVRFVLASVIGAMTAFLSRKLRYIPILSLIVPVYGAIATVLAAILGIFVVAPLWFVVSFVELLLRARPKVRGELERGVATVQTGVFAVIDRQKAGGSITCGDVKLHLDEDDLAQMRGHLRGDGTEKTFAGSVTYFERSKVILEAQPASTD